MEGFIVQVGFFFKLFLPIFANKGFFYLENLLVKVALIGCDLFPILVLKNERSSLKTTLEMLSEMLSPTNLLQIACEWQKCIGDTINLVSPLQCG